MPQIECESVSLTGGSGCAVTTTIPGVNGTVSRFKPDGTPDNFTALGSNAIDGKGAEDGTPQEGLAFFPSGNVNQVAIDESGGPTDGDIYVTQVSNRLVDVFSPSGKFLGQLTKSEEVPGNEATFKVLNEPCGVTVDPSGNVFADDFTAIHKYTPTANPVDNGNNVANLRPAVEACAVAAGTGPTAGVSLRRPWRTNCFKLNATSGALQYEISTGNTTVAVNPADGHLFVAAGNEIREYDASGESSATLLNTITVGSEVSGIAIDGTSGKGGTVYFSRAGSAKLEAFGPFVVVPDVLTQPADEITGTTATLHGTVSADNGSNAGCEFQYTSEEAFLEHGFTGASTAPCVPGGLPFSGSTVNPVTASATGLNPASKYEFRIFGLNASAKKPTDDPGGVLSFETLGPPLIKGSAASEITPTTALVSGEVNPRGLPTSFEVEYLSDEAFQANVKKAEEEGKTEEEIAEAAFTGATTAPVPAQELGEESKFLAVSVQLVGLEVATTYHFRLVAENKAAPTKGQAGTFSTFAVIEALLDNRAYEMVSPVAKLGEVYPPEPEQRGGLGGTCTSCVPGWEKQRMPMQSSPDGDAVAYEGNPFSAGLAGGANEYVAKRGSGGWATRALSKPQFSSIKPQGFKAFSSDLAKTILYQVEPPFNPEAPPNYANLYLGETGGELSPLITEAPKNRPAGVLPQSFQINYAGANSGSEAVAAFSHVIFQANDQLTEEVAGIAPKAPPVSQGETDLYEWSGGELHLVNVLEGNSEAVANAVFGSGTLSAQAENFDFDHAISADGSRIFWSEQPSGQVYVREDGQQTLKIPDEGKFLTATPEGSKVLLDDGKVYDLEDGTLTDLTAGQEGFQGMLGASEDLSRIYFIDTAVLAGGKNANKEAAVAGKFNLYLWEEGAVPHEGSTTFIGRLLIGQQRAVGGRLARGAGQPAGAGERGRALSGLPVKGAAHAAMTTRAGRGKAAGRSDRSRAAML